MFRRIAGLVLIAMIVAGCSDDPSGPDPNAHVGTYSLVSLNGASLPADWFTSQGVTYTALSGRVTFNADGTASDYYSFKASDGVTSIESSTGDVGTYARNGSSLIVRWSSGPYETFSFDGNDELTMTSDGAALVYRK